MLCMPLEEKEDEWEILCSRLIDHCIRPLFPTGLYRHIEVKSTVLSSGGIYCPDVMAVNATSAALMLSDIPWNGPIGVIRVARIEGKFIVHPTMHELSCSDLNLVYACTKSCTMMIDGNSELITEKDLQTALFLAHSEAVKYLCPQFQLAKMAGKNKRREKIFIPSRRIIQRTRSIARKQLERFFTKNIYNKFERGEAFHKHITPAVQMKLYDEGYGGKLPLWRHLPLWRNAVDMVRKEIICGRIIKEELRVDGRQLHCIRSLLCEFNHLSKVTTFRRGSTEVIFKVELKAHEDAQLLDQIIGPKSKCFELSYRFIGHATPNRRDVGHGALARKALLPVLPTKDDFPRIPCVESHVTASDATMALIKAGVPLREYVAGLAIGIVTDVDRWHYYFLTDILGLEDHIGDVDFKIAGTKNGITAFQLLPQEIGVSTHCDRGAVESAVINQKVSVEMFDGIIREVVEEIGVPAESLTNPLFIGISRRVMNVRPTAFFFLKCSLEANEVCELYSRAQDGYESTQICTVSRDDLKKMAVKMPGCHHGGFALYELMMEALKDN